MQRLLSTQIVIVGKISNEEARHLEDKLQVSELALQRFIANQISFADYLDIMELCDIDIDDYLINVERNISTLG
ncbi:MAG: hypothetical protein V7K26_00090 [Nostoc sp.]|uniref:hypothetical protein n=1 Tax=Nostoc sp. TaxID=1180 RepID=UPI002FF1FEB4